MSDDERDDEPTAEQLREPTRERLRDIQHNVAHLIELVEGTDPRDHEAAGAMGKQWAHTLSVAIWMATDRLETSLFPHFPARVNSGRRINTFWWPAYVQAALDRLLDVTDVLIRRWRAPKFCEKLRTAKGDDPALGDDPDQGTHDAIIERDELDELRKINKELIRGLEKTEGVRPDESGDQPTVLTLEPEIQGENPSQWEGFLCFKAEALRALNWSDGYVGKLDELKSLGQLDWWKAPADTIEKGTIVVWLPTYQRQQEFNARVEEERGDGKKNR